MKSTLKLVAGILGVFALGLAIVFWAKFESRRDYETLQERAKPFATQVNSPQMTNSEAEPK